MKRIGFLLVAVAATAGVLALLAPASGHADEAVPACVSQVPPGYRDWKLISVAHEEGRRRPAIGMSIVDAATAALPTLIANLALEISPVRVNLIAAGFVDTPLSAELLGEQLEIRRKQLRNTLPIGRVVGPADVAALAVHIMTNTALTGATYDIDGGQQFVAA